MNDRNEKKTKPVCTSEGDGLKYMSNDNKNNPLTIAINLNSCRIRYVFESVRVASF